jgi:hypothetical protein
MLCRQVRLVTEDGEPARQVGCLGLWCHHGRHWSKETVLDLTIHEVYSSGREVNGQDCCRKWIR